ncbi:MAG: glycosyltransferase [Candidatus Liptonbacteria bacterium]|nr:glycosyltransferase [Candidatus Liptonbacteria bacterium]
MNSPRLSILAPVLNVEKYVAETIESVLAQSYQDWELIFMDGQSKDRTLEILRGYAARDSRIRVYSEPDECSWHAFDKMFDLMRGEYLCNIMGQDGFLDPQWFEKAMKVFEEDPNVSLVWGLGQSKAEDGTLLPGAYDLYYGQFIGGKVQGTMTGSLMKKALQLIKDFIFGGARRRKIILDNIFSRHAKLKWRLFKERNLAKAPPQKENWLLYWLDTGLTFLDQSLIVHRDVFLRCMPRYKKGSRVIGYFPEFFYRFSAEGYLPYFIPSYAVFARQHPGNSTERAWKEMHEGYQTYLHRVMKLREELLHTGGPVIFRNPKGEPIMTKKIVNHTLV